MSNPPELFASGRGSGRPVRSDFSRRGAGPSYAMRRCITVSLIVLLMGFGVYKIWRGPSTPGVIPTIKSEGSYKERPDQPGGIDIPHQDVQVYNQIDGNPATDAKPGIEHMLPPPEEPAPGSGHVMSLAASSSDMDVSVEDLTADAASHHSVTVPVTQSAPAAAAVVAPEPVAPVAVSPASPAPEDPIAALGAPSAPVVTTVTHAQPAPQPVAPSVAPPVMAKTAPPPEMKSSTGTTMIQLAAVPNETGAMVMAKKLQAKYASALGDAHLHPVRAEIPGKGVFYRIRSQGLSAGQARSVCAALKSMHTECILVRP